MVITLWAVLVMFDVFRYFVYTKYVLWKSSLGIVSIPDEGEELVNLENEDDKESDDIELQSKF